MEIIDGIGVEAKTGKYFDIGFGIINIGFGNNRNIDFRNIRHSENFEVVYAGFIRNNDEFGIIVSFVVEFVDRDMDEIGVIEVGVWSDIGRD